LGKYLNHVALLKHSDAVTLPKGLGFVKSLFQTEEEGHWNRSAAPGFLKLNVDG
jgi:hypothetical protein